MTPKRSALLQVDGSRRGAARYQRSLIDHSYEAMRFGSMDFLKLERDGQIVWTTLSMADRKESGYPGRDDADLINELSAISDAAISIVFVEHIWLLKSVGEQCPISMSH
jgi:hypothetical protein